MSVRFPPIPKALSDLGRDAVLWLDRLAHKRAAPQDDSTAADVSDLKDDFNALLAKLRAAGLMEE